MSSGATGEQLKFFDGMLCREYQVNGFGEIQSAIVVPTMMKQTFLPKCHDLLSAGHQGWQKTLDRLKSIGYWIGMAIFTSQSAINEISNRRTLVPYSNGRSLKFKRKSLYTGSARLLH